MHGTPQVIADFAKSAITWDIDTFVSECYP